jgi:hypothetical protein
MQPTGKYLFSFQEFLIETVGFLQCRGDFLPQLEDYMWLQDLAFLTYLTAKQYYLNSELIIDTSSKMLYK